MNAHEIATFLQDHPDFFMEHAEVFAALRVPEPHGGKAISLADRQLQTVREKARTLELRLAELVHNAKSNEGLEQKLAAWVRSLLSQADAGQLPAAVTEGLTAHFDLPMAALRLWNVAPTYAQASYTQGVSEDVRLFTDGLMAPFCGENTEYEAARWLSGAEPAASVALIPLRAANLPDSFGLLVLGSPDAERFTPNMGTAFLSRIGNLAGAALSRLLPG